MNRKYTLFLLLLAFCQAPLLQAQGWERLYPLGLGLIDYYRIAPMGDGGFLVSASVSNPNLGTHALIRLSPSGAVEWIQDQQSVLGITQLAAILPIGQGELLFLGQLANDTRLVKTDANLNVLWSKSFIHFPQFFCNMPNGYVHAQAFVPSDFPPISLTNIDLNGETVWQNVYQLGNEASNTGIRFFLGIDTDSQGNIYLSGVEDFPYRPNLVKISPSGDLIYQKSYPQSDLSYGFLSLTLVNDNRIVGACTHNMAVLDSAGNVVSIIPQPVGISQKTADGNLLVGYFNSTNLHIRKIGLDGTEYWKHTTDLGWIIESMHNVQELLDGGALAIGRVFTGSSYDPIIIRTDANGLTYTNHLSGRVLAALDGACPPTLPDALPAAGRIVQLEKQGDLLFTTTDADGNYHLSLDSGTYLLRVLPPNGLWQACPDEAPVTFSVFFDSLQQDLGLSEQISCPWPEVQLGASFLRRCFPSTYTVQYANNGSIVAEDAVVRLILDPYLSIEAASLPYTEVEPHIFEFPVDDLPPLSKGSFTVTVLVDCDSTTLGQIHCSTAEIRVGNPCASTPIAVPIIQVAATCDGDSAQFIIRNIGDAPMTVPAEFIVIEDLIVMRQGTFQLDAHQEIPVRCPSDGSTMRMYAGQMPGGVPFFSPTAAIEGCNGPVQPGFWNMFPELGEGADHDRDCQPNIGSYDPNDKNAVPTGYDTERYIGQNVPLAYTIRFQNTGTDTAFTVVIRDTLSPWLDPLTVRPGASSHDYHFDLTGSGILIFDYQNILLPDSNVNEPASHGFVQFRVSPRADVPLETDILNRAAIYFDFNDPIITNTTVHRIGENFITVRAWSPAAPKYAVQVAPHPVSESAWVRLSGAPETGDYRLRLFDAGGRLAREMTADAPQFLLHRAALRAGAYFFLVERNGAPMGSGTLVVK